MYEKLSTEGEGRMVERPLQVQVGGMETGEEEEIRVLFRGCSVWA